MRRMWAMSSHASALAMVFSFDDLNGPAADLLECPAQLWYAVAAIGKDVAKQGVFSGNRAQHLGRAVTILNTGPMHDKTLWLSITLAVGLA